MQANELIGGCDKCQLWSYPCTNVSGLSDTTGRGVAAFGFAFVRCGLGAICFLHMTVCVTGDSELLGQAPRASEYYAAEFNQTLAKRPSSIQFIF